MGFAEMVVIIVFIGCVTGLLSSMVKRRGGGPAVAAKQLDEQAFRLARLEERVRVLEAVVTDSSFQLKNEIDNL